MNLSFNQVNSAISFVEHVNEKSMKLLMSFIKRYFLSNSSKNEAYIMIYFYIILLSFLKPIVACVFILITFQLM